MLLIDRVQRRLSSLLLRETGLLLAVSGGSDSMGLLYLMVALRERMGLRLMVGFVDHGLRDGVDAEFDLVKKASLALQVPVERRAIPKLEAAEAAAAGSVQEWARNRRYHLLAAMAEENGLDVIATGHTEDDQAETVMLRLLRGTGIDGLRGVMARRALDSGGVLIRPLLDVGRDELRAFLSERGADYVDDPSNDNERFLRVRVRKELLPLMETFQPGVNRRLAAVAEDASAMVAFVESSCFTPQKTFKRLRLGGGVKVERSVFTTLPRGLWGRVIRQALLSVRGNLRRFERCHIVPIENHIEDGDSTGALPLPGDIEAHIFHGDLFLFRSPLPAPPTGAGYPTAMGAGQWKARFAALGAMAEVTAPNFSYMEGLEVRSRRPGDKLYGSTRRFKEILIRAKVPRPYRNFVPVLAVSDEVISCPGFLPSRKSELQVNWMFDENAPFLDVDFV